MYMSYIIFDKFGQGIINLLGTHKNIRTIIIRTQ